MNELNLQKIREEIYSKFFSLGTGKTTLHWGFMRNNLYIDSLLFNLTYHIMPRIKPHVQ